MPTAFRIECKKHALKQRVDGTWELALTCHPDDMALAVLQAPMGTQWIAAFAEYEGKEPEQPKEKRAFGDMPRSQQAGMRCAESAFQAWLGHDNATDCAVHVRDACGVDSRSELDTDGVAAGYWDQLDGNYRSQMGLIL